MRTSRASGRPRVGDEGAAGAAACRAVPGRRADGRRGGRKAADEGSLQGSRRHLKGPSIRAARTRLMPCLLRPVSPF